MTERATISVVPCESCFKLTGHEGRFVVLKDSFVIPVLADGISICGTESEANSKADSLAGEAGRAQPENKNLELASYVALRLPKERTSEAGFLYDTGDRSELGKIILNLIERFADSLATPAPKRKTAEEFLHDWFNRNYHNKGGQPINEVTLTPFQILDLLESYEQRK